MRVKITFHNGYSLVGNLEVGGDDTLLGDALNDDRMFIEVARPNGTLLQLNKEAVAYIVKEGE
jgi:hypothetical protein